MSSSRRPYLSTARSRMRLAIEIFRSAVRAIALSLSSSIVPATTAAPYFFASAQICAELFLAVLEVHRVEDAPPAGQLQPRFHHGRVGAVEHQRHVERLLTYRCTTSCMSRTPSRPTKSTQTSSMCEPSRTSSRAIADQAVPVLFLKQPLELPRAVGVGPLGDDQVAEVLPDVLGAVKRRDLRLGDDRSRGFGSRGPSPTRVARASCRCSGIVPQHPPTMFTPNSSTNRIIPLVKSAGPIGKCALAVDHHRQAGVRQRADEPRPVLGDEPDDLGQLVRPERAVQPEHIDFVDTAGTSRRAPTDRSR